MPNDAKLGLVVGVGLVIAVALVFFRKDAPVSADPAAHSVRPAPAAPATSPAPPVPGPGRTRSVEARTGIRTSHAPIPGEGRCHTVREGDTLFSLAQQYYGDRDKFDLIYRSNRGRLDSPDALKPGTVLVIPEAAEAP
jgi:nucleoid-associated protein YgaU